MANAQAEFIINACLNLEDDAAVKVITDALTLRPEVAPIVVNNTCPSLTYAPASSMTASRSAGIVKTTAGPNGFGFLACPEIKLIFGTDVYVHKDQLGDLTPGTEVNFAVLLSKEMKPQAFDIQPGHDDASDPPDVSASHMAAARLLAPKNELMAPAGPQFRSDGMQGMMGMPGMMQGGGGGAPQNWQGDAQSWGPNGGKGVDPSMAFMDSKGKGGKGFDAPMPFMDGKGKGGKNFDAMGPYGDGKGKGGSSFNGQDMGLSVIDKGKGKW